MMDSSSVFSITEHVIPSQHIREYHNAVRDELAPLQLAIKEYRPFNNLDAEPGSVTIIATHGLGFPKECYEPLWEELIRTAPFKIRGIWIADCSHLGASGVLNENIQGDDPNWFDHSRDLLYMVNVFRERMIRPIFGIGHSMGATQLVQLSIMHPRLFYGLSLFEPIIQNESPPGPNAAMLSSFRKDIWPSRAEAEASLIKNPLFKILDPRATKKYFQFGLREVPTAIYPISEKSNIRPGAVTLTTTKHQEAWSYLRPNFAPLPSDPSDRRERLISPDQNPLEEGIRIFVCSAALLAFLALPQLRPDVLWVFGSASHINIPERIDEKMKTTGIGRGGSGGVKAGRVQKVIVEKAGHFAPFQAVSKCAEIIRDWMEKELERYRQDEEFYNTHQSRKSEGTNILSKEWLKAVRLDSAVKRPTKEKL